MVPKYFTFLIITFFTVSTLSSQSHDQFILVFGEKLHDQERSAKSILTISRNAEHPFKTMGEAIYEQSISGDLEIFDLQGNKISTSKLKEYLSVTDTATVHNFETFEEIIVITENNIEGKDFRGFEVDISLKLNGEKVESQIHYLSPFTYNRKLKKIQQCYFVATENGCRNPDYGYLVSMNLDKEKHLDITNHLFNILDGIKDSDVIDAQFQPLTKDDLRQRMVHKDTSVYMSYETYEERVEITETEVDREDLELNVVGELIYCSEKGKFDFEVLAVGFTEDVVDSKTGMVKSKRNLFLTRVD